jgi:hypothetical protein
MAEPSDRDLQQLLALDGAAGPAQPIDPARAASIVTAALHSAGFPPPGTGGGSTNGGGNGSPHGAGPHGAMPHGAGRPSALRGAQHAAGHARFGPKLTLLAGGTAAVAVAIVAWLIVRAPDKPPPDPPPQLASSQPASSQPASSQPASSQPASSQPASSQTASSQTASSQPASSQPASPQPASPQPASSQTASPQPASSQPASSQTASSQPASPQTASSQPASPQIASSQPASPQTASGQRESAQSEPTESAGESPRHHTPPRAPAPAKPHATPPPTHRRRLPPRTAAIAASADPEDLLAEANAARLARNWRGADALYTRVASAGGTALAAQTALVASAQLHLEHLGDPEGAARRFGRALTSGAGGTLAEEARWGLAEVARANRDSAAERRTLDDFLAHHAGSVRATQARARRAELEAAP